MVANSWLSYFSPPSTLSRIAVETLLRTSRSATLSARDGSTL